MYPWSFSSWITLYKTNILEDFMSIMWCYTLVYAELCSQYKSMSLIRNDKTVKQDSQIQFVWKFGIYEQYRSYS
jgi:hypothetical protein